MFRYITGNLAEKGLNHAVVDVNGVGFKIYTSLNSLSAIQPDSRVTFYTYLYLKEGIMDLYGFVTDEELTMFELLLTVSGVGAKGALSILSVAPVQKIALAIATGDVATIKQASGIGPKIAQRVVLELKDKVNRDQMSGGGVELPSAQVMTSNGDSRAEAVSALMVLGYSNGEAIKAVSRVDDSVSDVEEIVKQALKKLL
ncbi:MAG: Holliday junction branch migration protein RuvA [Ruminococcaceae bacterium]|nr:Holliday junction branch migration protein RuvA [Oscillospiraceae bacterium]